MPRLLLTFAVLAGAAWAAGPAISQPTGRSPPEPSRLLRVAADGALAYGPGGTLTRDAAEAFVEALEFTLAELGAPASFGPDQRVEIHQALAAGFGGLTHDDQTVLAEFRGIWTLTRQSWATLALEDKRQFARAVLAVAFGEGAADRALGSTGGDTGTFEDRASDFCARNGGCGGAMDGLNSYVPSYD
jgi:hypothetical protein